MFHKCFKYTTLCKKGVIKLAKKLDEKQAIKVYNYMLGLIDAES